MKIIEGLKQIKALQKKLEDLRGKIGKYCAYANFETPIYTDQKKQVREWLQSHEDLMKEILSLRMKIQKTNLITDVTIELGGKKVTKSIAEWIHRRRDLAENDRLAWEALNDKGIKEGITTDSQGEKVEVKIIRCYDPVERDNKVELYRSEPMTIDSTLEIINATTDLVE
jgi:hypothetical protein